MIVRRSVPTCVILSIVTCGLYMLYWFVCVTNEADAVTEEYGPGGGMSLLLTIITCGIYGVYWCYKMGQFLDEARGTPGGSQAIAYLLLSLFGLDIIALALMQSELNRFSPNDGY